MIEGDNEASIFELFLVLLLGQADGIALTVPAVPGCSSFNVFCGHVALLHGTLSELPGGRRPGKPVSSRHNANHSEQEDAYPSTLPAPSDWLRDCDKKGQDPRKHRQVVPVIWSRSQ